MYHVRKDTLAYHKARPLMVARDARTAQLQVTVQAMNAYFETKPGETDVEESALLFYMTNHAYALLAQKFDVNEPLGEYNKVAEFYVKVGSEAARRLMYYVLLITSREARHLHESAALRKKLDSLFGPQYADFRDGMPDNPTGAVNHFRSHAPKMTVGNYVAATCMVFKEGKFGGGFGGQPWWNIAETLRRMMYGETSPELFIDTAWTLAHNGGPMFNKGMLYAHWKPDLKKILDVQRAGMTPQLIWECLNNSQAVTGVTSRVINTYKALAALFPVEFKGNVDWFRVQQLGAQQNYASEQKKQVAQFGYPESMKQMQELEKKKFWVGNGPNDYVLKKERKAA